MHKVTCVRVGYGTVAQIHETKLRSLGVCTVAIVDASEEKRVLATSHGFAAFASCAAAAYLHPTFWDICTDTSHHIEVIEEIFSIEQSPNILVEKPVCDAHQIARLRALLSEDRGTLVVNENYHSSAVSERVKHIAIERLHLRIRRIIVEMSKNRTVDFEMGRFVDKQLDALGYEGSHMFAVLSDLGEQFLPGRILSTSFDDLVFFSKESDGNALRLSRQGIANVQYISQGGTMVEIHTALNGTVKHHRPPYGSAMIGGIQNVNTKYRALILEGEDEQGQSRSVVGFFEPVASLERCTAAVVVLKGDQEVDSLEILEDDSMKRHLQRAVHHFTRRTGNPGNVLVATRIVDLLHQCALAPPEDVPSIHALLNRKPHPNGSTDQQELPLCSLVETA